MAIQSCILSPAMVYAGSTGKSIKMESGWSDRLLIWNAYVFSENSLPVVQTPSKLKSVKSDWDDLNFAWLINKQARNAFEWERTYKVAFFFFFFS